MSETARLVIVGCGAAKQDDPAPAKDLYTSTYFAKKREYAVELGDFWAVLSAEHGLIEPTAEIAPYDTTISDLDEDDLGELAHSVGIGLIDWVAHLAGSGVTVDEIVVLAGRSYIHPLKEREAFAAGIEAPVVYPLQQNNLGGIGEQMAWLSDRISSTNTTQQRLVPDGGERLESEEQQSENIYAGIPETTEYGVRVVETSPNGWRHVMRFWTPEPSSREEALEIAAEDHDEVLSSLDDVNTRSVPQPEGWSDE